MAHFKFYYVVLGGHTHLTLFSGKSRDGGLGRCGDVTMTNEEFNDFRGLTRQAAIEFVKRDGSEEP